jgi:hypothetical protein
MLQSLSFFSKAQDVETFFDRFKQKPFKMGGGFSANQTLYGISGIEPRQNPYTYTTSGNINFSVYGWNIPLSFNYSNQEFNYKTPHLMPYNQFGLTPYYKWVKLYLGYNSISFSPYTLNGHTFYGTGIELTPPGWIKFCAMYGKLQNAIEEDTLASVQPAYKRKGFGFKLSLGKENGLADLILFYAKDDTNSIHRKITKSPLFPSENLVYSINLSKTFFSKIGIKADYAISAYSRDIKQPVSDDISSSVFRNTLTPFVYRQSTSAYSAFKTSANYNATGYTIGFAYERVDPGYQTSGAYYFNNNLENIALNTTTQLLKGKMNILFNFGVQRDNLDKSNISSMKKIVSALNLSYSPSPKYNITASYSNFSAYTNIRSNFEKINQSLPVVNIDTLNFTQITQSTNLNTFVLLGDQDNKDLKQSLNLNFSYQVAAQKQGVADGNNKNGFFNANFSYIWNKIPQNLTVTFCMNASKNNSELGNSLTIGPTLLLSKPLYVKEFRNTLSFSFNNSYLGGKKQNRVKNLRINSSYTIKKKHSLGMTIILLNRKNKEAENTDFTECTGTLTYSYAF